MAGNHVGMQVGVQEGEHGELSDRFHITRGGDRPAGKPIPVAQPIRQRRPPATTLSTSRPADASQLVKKRCVVELSHPKPQAVTALHDHAQRAQVAQHGHAQRLQPMTDQDRDRQLKVRGGDGHRSGTSSGVDLACSPHSGSGGWLRLKANAEGAHRHQAEQGRQDQVVGEGRHDAQPA